MPNRTHREQEQRRDAPHDFKRFQQRHIFFGRHGRGHRPPRLLQALPEHGVPQGSPLPRRPGQRVQLRPRGLRPSCPGHLADPRPGTAQVQAEKPQHHPKFRQPGPLPPLQGWKQPRRGDHLSRPRPCGIPGGQRGPVRPLCQPLHQRQQPGYRKGERPAGRPCRDG